MIFRNLAKDTAVYGGADLITKLVAFFTFPIIAAALSPQDFGSLELITTLVGLLGMLMSCGLNNATQRFYWDDATKLVERPVIVSTGLGLQLMLGAILAIICFSLMPIFINQTARFDMTIGFWGLCAAILLIITTQTTQYIQDVIRLHFKPWRFLVFTTLGRVIVALSAVIAVLYYQANIDGILLVQAIVGILVFPVGLYLIRKDLTKNLSKKWSEELVRFGYPFIFAGLAYWLFGSMDRWMLASMASIEEVGIYSVAFRFSSIVLFVSAAFGQAWSPHAIKLKADHPEKYRKFYAHILLLLLYFMLIAGGGLALFSGEIIFLIMPEEYYGSAIPLSILCFGIVFQATQQITASGISLEKKTSILMAMAWVAAIVNFFGNLLLIPIMGSTGAAWSTLISYMVLTSGYLFFSQKLHSIPIDWKKLATLLLLGSMTLGVSIIFNQQDLVFSTILIKLLWATLCLLLGWFLLPREEIINTTASSKAKDIE